MFRRVMLGLLVCLVHCQIAVYAQICMCENETFRDMCNATVDTGGRIIEQYVNNRVSLDCGSPDTITKRLLAGTDVLEVLDTSDQSKYSIASSVLTIMNLGPEDEGIYECSGSSQRFCILVVHGIDFLACPLNTDNCEAAPVDVINGSAVTLDTRITFGQSVCNCRQQIDSYFFTTVSAGNTSLRFSYSCTSGLCQNTSEYEISDSSSNFTFTITTPLPVEANGSRFSLRIFGPIPPSSGGSGTADYRVFFNVFIREPSPTLPSTAAMTTPIPPNSTNIKIDPIDPIAPTVGTILATLLLVAMIAVALVAFCMYRRSTKHHTITKRKPKTNEVIYADIDDKRGSRAYSSIRGQAVPPDLSTTLESVSVSA